MNMREQILTFLEKNSKIDLKELAILLGSSEEVIANEVQKMEEELGIQDGGITADGKFSLDSVRCIGACGLAPAMVVNGEVYGRMTADKIHDIIASCE